MARPGASDRSDRRAGADACEGGPNGADDVTAAIAEGFRRYVNFQGRSNRPEFWHWVLFAVLGDIVTELIKPPFFDPSGQVSLLNGLFTLATFVPSVAVAIRRLHDIGRSGQWRLLWFGPAVGWMILIVWHCQPGDRHCNDWG